jgi:hypothetical protein
METGDDIHSRFGGVMPPPLHFGTEQCRRGDFAAWGAGVSGRIWRLIMETRFFEVLVAPWPVFALLAGLATALNVEAVMAEVKSAKAGAR